MKYTIEDLKNGKCAVKNDGTLEELKEVLRLAFPEDKGNILGNCEYYYKYEVDGGRWDAHDHHPNMISQSVKDFLKINEIADKLASDYNKCNEGAKERMFSPQKHYNNDNGSLYKIAEQRGWISYTFDVVKRLDRGGKKDPLRQEIEKSIDVLKLWLLELED